MGQRVHVYPLADLVDHDTDTEGCVCGPRVECVPSDSGDGWLVVHASLDGREANE